MARSCPIVDDPQQDRAITGAAQNGRTWLAAQLFEKTGSWSYAFYSSAMRRDRSGLFLGELTMFLTQCANFLTSRPALFLLVALMSLNGALFAQITIATLTGAVKDATGAVVPRARIEAVNRGTGLVRSAVSDSNGQYILSDLPAGHYQIKVSLAGFMVWVLPDFEF